MSRFRNSDSGALACNESMSRCEQVVEQLWRKAIQPHQYPVITGIVIGNVIDVRRVFDHGCTLPAVYTDQQRSRLRSLVGGHTRHQLEFASRPLYFERRTSEGSAFLDPGEGDAYSPYIIESDFGFRYDGHQFSLYASAGMATGSPVCFAAGSAM